MRISWLSNAPWSSTGYGNQTRLFVPRLQAAGHELAVIAFYGLEGGVLSMAGGVPVLPRAYHPYGQDIAGAHSVNHRADIMISLMDAWVCEPRQWPPEVRWAPWFPVDMEPLPNAIRERVGVAYERIVYSRFGERMVHDAGLDCHYVPHGVDTAMFRPRDKRAIREQIGMPTDAFVIGMVAANKGYPCRKSFFEQIEAFAQFKRLHSDAVLYLHTVKGPVPGGEAVNLPEFCDLMGLREGIDVIYPPQYQLAGTGLSDETMAQIFSTFDVLTSVSMGEGFGIPILEAQACGVPVIVGDWTAMPELCFGGWALPREDAQRTYTPLAAWQYTPRPEAIAALYEVAYGTAETKRDAARAGALAYDADVVMRDYWQPVLGAIAERIAAETPRPPRVYAETIEAGIQAAQELAVAG